MTRTTLSSWS